MEHDDGYAMILGLELNNWLLLVCWMYIEMYIEIFIFSENDRFQVAEKIKIKIIKILERRLYRWTDWVKENCIYVLTPLMIYLVNLVNLLVRILTCILSSFICSKKGQLFRISLIFPNWKIKGQNIFNLPIQHLSLSRNFQCLTQINNRNNRK